MNIDRVRVKGLFDDFDHDLAFRTGERIMLVIGPNGFGKTTTLELINVLFNGPIIRLASMPFREVEVSFDNGTRLIAERVKGGRQNKGDRLPLVLTYHGDGAPQAIQLSNDLIGRTKLRATLSRIREALPQVSVYGIQEWRNNDTGVTHDLHEALTVYWGDFPPDLRRDLLPMPDWLQDTIDAVSVRLIDIERLTRVPPRRRRWRTVNASRTVSHYSNLLARRIRESIAEYGALSQSLDRTFPVRLVSDHMHSRSSAEALRKDLDAIDKRRSQLEDVGLLAVDQPGLEIPDLSQVNESQRGVLAVYAQDAKEKLAVFNELYKKVSTFKRIANSRFRHKQVAASTKGLSVTKDDGTPLDLEKLSSGEQHELVMLYELLFRASGNSLILIDEPELSLHVAWQEQWVQDLEEAARLSDFRAIVATHSPEIIGYRWDLTVELRGRDQ